MVNEYFVSINSYNVVKSDIKCTNDDSKIYIEPVAQIPLCAEAYKEEDGGEEWADRRKNHYAVIPSLLGMTRRMMA